MQLYSARRYGFQGREVFRLVVPIIERSHPMGDLMHHGRPSGRAWTSSMINRCTIGASKQHIAILDSYDGRIVDISGYLEHAPAFSIPLKNCTRLLLQ